MTPNIPLETVPSNSLQPSVPINDSLQTLDALVRPGGIVQGFEATPPTTTDADAGMTWVVDAGASGAFSGHVDEIALCTAANLWRFFSPKEGWLVHNLADGDNYAFLGSAGWTVEGGGGGASVSSVQGKTGAVVLVQNDIPAAINDETSSYTAVLTDEVVIMDNSSANNFTVPANASAAFPVGAFLEVWQKGAGQTTIVADGGVTILYHADLTLKLKGQNSGCSLRKVATNTWRLIGDMEPV